MKNSLRNIPSYFAATVLVVGTMAGVRAETVDSRIGSLSFERGLPTEDTVTKLFDTLDFQRACQAYIWALPLVGIGTFQRAHYQTFGASDGDIVIYQTYRDKLGILTPNATTPYIISFVNLARTGPVVIDLPAGPNASGVSDFWQHAVTDMGQTGPDKGAGGKYLVIGPGQTEPPNVEANSFDKRFAGSLYRPEAHWDYVIAVDWTAETEFYRQIDELSAYCYEASGTSKGMVTKTPGVGQAYLATYRDKDGHAFDGAKTYRLRVPPNAPAKNFWSVTLYDLDTRTFIENKEEIADRSSRMDLRKNDDGSVDVYFGPTAPAGFENNWIPTIPGKAWFTYLRLYGPMEAYFDKSWPLPDIEEVK